MTNQQPPSFESDEDEGYEGPDVEMPVGDQSGLRDTADVLSDTADSSVSTRQTASDDSGEPKPDGLGQDGTIPDEPDGLAAGHAGEPSTFEPEEDRGGES